MTLYYYNHNATKVDYKQTSIQEDGNNNPLIYLTVSELKQLFHMLLKKELTDFFSRVVNEMNEQKNPEFMTLKQTSEFLCTSVSTIHRMVNRGILKKHRFGPRKVLFRRTEVIEISERHRKWFRTAA